MATLIRPKLWGQQKPPPGAQINWGHPLAQGLSRCWLLGHMAAPTGVDDSTVRSLAFDLVRGDRIASARFTGTAVIQSPIGGAWQSAADGSGVGGAAGAAIAGTLGSGFGSNSVTVAAYWGTTPGAANPNYGAGYPLYSTRLLSSDISPTLLYDGTDLIFLADGPNLAVGAQTGWSPVTGNWYQSVGTWDKGQSGAPGGGPGSFSVYLNGDLGASNNLNVAGTFAGTWTSDVLSGANSYLSGGPSRTTGLFCADRRVGYLYSWTRALSQSEVRWLYAEPYAFIAPAAPARRLWAFVPPQSANPPDAPGTAVGIAGTPGINIIFTN